MKKSLRTTIPHYSYKQKNTTDKTIYKRLAIIIGSMVVLLIAIWFWGTTFINILGFLGNDGDENSKTGLTLPLRKPTLEELPEYTNKENITVSGSVTPEVNLLLYVNGIEQGKTTSDIGGKFSFVNVNLKEGLNLIKVVANKDNEKQEATILVNLDTTKPEISLETPKNGQTFDKQTKYIVIKGKTEPDSIVLVNLIQAITDNEGNFSYQLNISKGENKIEVKATDKAENVDTVSLKVAISD